MAIGGAHLHQASNVGGFATVGEVVQHVRVRPVDQDGDDMIGYSGLGDDVADDLTVLADEPCRGRGPWWWRTAEELEDRRRHVDQSTGGIDHSESLHPCSGDDEGCSSLHHTQSEEHTSGT